MLFSISTAINYFIEKSLKYAFALFR